MQWAAFVVKHTRPADQVVVAIFLIRCHVLIFINTFFVPMFWHGSPPWRLYDRVYAWCDQTWHGERNVRKNPEENSYSCLDSLLGLAGKCKRPSSNHKPLDTTNDRVIFIVDGVSVGLLDPPWSYYTPGYGTV